MNDDDDDDVSRIRGRSSKQAKKKKTDGHNKRQINTQFSFFFLVWFSIMQTQWRKRKRKKYSGLKKTRL